MLGITFSYSHIANSQQLPIGFSANTALDLSTDTNVQRLADNEKSDTILSVTPELNFLELYGKHRFTAKYEGLYSRFSDFDSLDYDEHKVALIAKLEHSLRFKTEFDYEYAKSVELPGLNDSITQALEEYNKVDQQAISLKATYGRDMAAGQVVVKYDNNRRKHNNNSQEFRDYDIKVITGTLFYRIAPNTRLVFEASSANIVYDNNAFNPGSSYSTYLVGAEWTPSAKTRGIIKLGQQEQGFDNSDLNDISGLAYFADVFWEPNTYSQLQLGASRSTRESSEVGVGSFISTEFNIKAKHEVTQNIAIETSLSRGKDDLVIGNNITLERYQFDFKIKHDTSRWFDSYIGIKHFSRNSNRKLYELKTNQFTIGIIGYFG